MCEIYDAGEKVFLYYPLDGEEFIPIILYIGDSEVETPIGPKMVKVITDVFNAKDEQNLVEIEASSLIGNPAPLPEYQSVSNLLGPPPTLLFSLDSNGNADIEEVTMFDQVQTIIDDIGMLDETLGDIKSSIEDLPQQIAAQSNDVVGATLDSYKNGVIDTLSQKISFQTNAYLAGLSHTVRQGATYVIDKVIEKVTDTESTIAGQISEDVGQVITEILSGPENGVIGQITGKLDALEENIDDKLATFLQQNSSNTIGETLNAYRDDMVGAIGRKIDAQTNTYLAGMSHTVRQGTNCIIGQVVAKIDDAKQGLEEQVVERISNVVTEVGNIATELAASVEEMSSNMRTDVLDILQSSGYDVVGPLTTKINDTEKKLESNMEEKLNEVIADVRHIVNEETRNTQKKLLSGIHDSETGVVDVLQNITRLLDLHGYQEDFSNTMHALTTILDDIGSIPQYYFGSIESLLIGHSRFSTIPLVRPSIESYVSHFETWSTHRYLIDLKPQIDKITNSINTIVTFVTTTDTYTTNSIVKLLHKIFGPRVPIVNNTNDNILSYSDSAHFSAMDFGLYGWIKDVHAILQEISLYPEDDLEALEEIAQLRQELEALFAGKVNDILVIPETYYCGLRNFLDILPDCAEIIKKINQFSPVALLEKKVDALAETVASHIERQEKQSQVIFDALRFLVYHFWAIDISKKPECVHLPSSLPIA
jgi:ribosomal protein S8